MDLRNWEDPDPAEVLVLASDADWASLAARYAAGIRDEPLRRCLEVARASGAFSVVIETRYIDLDYRSEYAAFYSRTFAAQPDSAHRLHFFRAPLEADSLWQLPPEYGYVGYVVVRPSRLGPVGRTMLAPPPGLEDAIRTSVRESVHFFGQSIDVEAVPFIQQDQQLDRCAHAAAWICHYTAHRAGLVARRAMASFSLMADPSLAPNRPLPSQGLTAAQIVELFRVLELPARLYDVRSLPSVRPTPPAAPPDPTPPVDDDGMVRHPGLWDPRIFSIICRYLNSKIPVLVGTRDHAFVLCGYRRRPRKGNPDWIEFIRQDDQVGPYMTVENVFDDVAPNGYRYSPWQLLIVPMPEKLWLTPEPAEGLGSRLLEAWARNMKSQVPDTDALLQAQARGDIAYRTYATSSSEFKARLDGRGVASEVLRAYRLARFSRFVWVVEAVDRAARRKGNPRCVVGEVVFDATSSELEPSALAIHVPGVMVLVQTPSGKLTAVRADPRAYESGGAGPA